VTNETLVLRIKKHSIDYSHRIRLGQAIYPLYHFFSIIAYNLTVIKRFRTLGLSRDYKFKSGCSLHILNFPKWALTYYTKQRALLYFLR